MTILTERGYRTRPRPIPRCIAAQPDGGLCLGISCIINLTVCYRADSWCDWVGNDGRKEECLVPTGDWLWETGWPVARPPASAVVSQIQGPPLALTSSSNLNLPLIPFRVVLDVLLSLFFRFHCERRADASRWSGSQTVFVLYLIS